MESLSLGTVALITTMNMLDECQQWAAIYLHAFRATSSRAVATANVREISKLSYFYTGRDIQRERKI